MKAKWNIVVTVVYISVDVAMHVAIVKTEME